VYSGVPEGPYTEDMFLPVISTNPTETWKKAWEITGLHYADRTGLDVVSARLSGIYGPLYHTLMNLPSRMAHAAAKGVAADFAGARGGVPFAEDQSDFCYVKDAAQGLQLLQMADKLPNRIYNVAAGVARTNQDVADAVQKVVPNVEIKLQPGRGPRFRPNQYLDITRAHEDVGYAPEYPLERAAEDYVGWLRKNSV
jgi:UDP-glucose 4-epimerase